MAIALLLLTLAATAVAGPVNSRYSSNSQCAAFCPENSKFGFETDKTYKYDYESAVKTHIPGASSDHSSLQMHAVAKLEVISRCEMALRLQSVDLKDVTPGSDQSTSAARSSMFATALERNALRFAFVSGNVESICPGTEEATWVLNIKRALLSHIQNTMNDFHVDFRSRETDVIGDCPVTYTTESAGWNGVHTIQKTKDIEACTGRLSADTVLQGTAYRTSSRMQSLPLMTGTHNCQQKINSQGVLTESACTESHIFRPFSKGSSGATTDITTKLTFKEVTAGVVTGGECGQARPITVDHEKTRETLTNSKTEAENVLREMCAQSTTGVSATTPSRFGKLVHALKKMNTESLVSLHHALTNAGFCPQAENYLHDAVPTLGTEASARLIKNLILSGEVSGTESALWLNSLAFVQGPSANMLSEVAPLVSTSPLNRHAALAVSSLVNNFCKETPNCGATQAVRDITTALEAHLIGGCAKMTTKHDEVMAALKALGNIGHGDVELLNTCIRNPAIGMEFRVTALNAFRRMGCSSDKSEVARTFENIQLDAELRINAYLALMACPTTDILIRVRNMLENEQVNQVGSFVWTHLTNLMETSSPLKQEIRQIVEQESLRKEFNVDKRKFSRNIEKSYFSDMLNSGASVESNIIFSPESFVPRSASVNLTTDLFGHSVNLVEIGGRVEGLNGILDDLFDTHAPADENKETTPEINRIDKNFAGKKVSEPKGSAYIRIFGNEIAYGDFHDLDASTVREKFNYLNWLIELAKEHTIDFSKSFQFIDTTMNTATITGFPLRMHVEGNGVTDIKLKGKVDLRNLATSPHSLIIDGSIAPSAAMEITAEMGVDAFAAQTGLRTVDNVHTSTVADGSIQLREGRIFAMDIKMARDKMEIFSAKHNLFVLYRGEARAMTMPASRFVYSKCMSGTFTTVTGLEICAEVAVPNEHSTTTGPYIPLTAPAHVSVVLNKRDTFNSYHFEAKAFREKVAHEGHMDTVDVALLTFNTHGSRVNREVTMDFSLNHSQKKVAFTLVTPWMPRAHFSGALTNTDVLKHATALASLGTISYQALAEVQISTNKYNTRFLPKFELKTPTGINPTISGSLLYRSGRKVDVSIAATDVFTETVTVEGSITGTSNAKKIRYETTMDIKSPLLRGKIDGFVDRSESDGTVYSSRLEVVYKPAGSPNNRLTFSSKIRDRNSAKKTDTSGTIAFTSNMWPSYDTDAKFSVLQQGKTLTSSFEGSLAGDERKTLKIEQNGLLNWNTHTKKANMKLDVTLPYMNVDYKLNMAHLHKKDLIQSSATLTKDGREHGLLNIDISCESVKPLKAIADIKFEYPGRQMRYQQSIEEVSNKHYKNRLSLQLEQDQTIILTTDYKMLPRHELKADLTTPFTSPVTFEGYLNPKLRNFQVKALVEHKARQYAAEAAMNLKANENHIFIQFVHPSRTITSDAEMKRVGKVISGMFETKWDATRDVNKKFSLTGEITLAKMRPRLSIKAEVFPNRFIEIITSGAFLHKGSNCNNQGSLTFRSSFDNFEEISATFNHKKTLSEMTASGQVSWAPDRKIDGDFTMNLRSGWNSVDANAKLITPFVAVRRITYQLDYAVEGNTFRANTKGVFNKHNIGFVLSGLTESQRTEGSVTMTSSIPKLEKLVLKASHVDTGRKCHTDAELTWGTNQKIALVYNMEHARSGYHLTNNGDLQVTTPFKGYRKNKITWTHSNDESSIKQHIEVEIFKKTTVYDFDGSLNTANNKCHLRINTFLTGPNISMKFNTEHEHNTENAQGIKTSALIQWQTGKRMQFTNDFNMDSSNLQESFKFISPFEDFETITLTLDNSLTERGISAKSEIKWPANKVSFNGLITHNKYEYDGNFQLETPFMPTQKITFSNNMEGTKYIIKKTYEYAPGQVLLLSTTWDHGRTKTFTVKFTSPFEAMEVVNFDYEYTGTDQDFNVKANFFHNLMADKVEMNMHIDTSDLLDLKATFNLKTPIHSLTHLRAKYSHKLEGRNFQCFGSFQIPSYKVTFNHEMTTVSWRHFNTKTDLMFKPGEKIELVTQFQVTRAIIAAVTFKYPFFDEMEEFTFNLKSEGMKNTFDVSIDKTKKFTGAFDFSHVKGIHTNAQLTTPFHGYKNLGLIFNYEGQMTDIKVDWAVNYEKDRIAGQTSFALEDGRMNLRSSVATPFPGYEKIVLTYDHEGSLYNFNCEGLFEFPGSKFTLKNNFTLTATGLNFKTEICTPFRSMRVFTAEATHEGPFKKFKNSVSFLLNHNKYEAKSNFRLVRNSVTGSAALLLPEEYSITIRHNGDETNFNNNMLVKYADEQISGESAYKYRGNNMEGSIKIQTPFAGYEKLSLIGNHQGPLNKFQCDYTIEFGKNKMTISDEFKLAGNKLTAKLDISTPFTNLRNINVAFNHEGPINSFKNGGFVRINKNMYTIASELSNAATSIKGKVMINIPEEYSVAFRHQGAISDFKNNFTIKADTIVIHGMSELKMNDGIEISATLNTPFHIVENVVYKFTHKGVSTNFEQQTTLIHGSSTYIKKARFEKRANEISVNYELRTPFEALRTLVVEANHNGRNFKNFHNNINVIHNGYKRSADTDFKWFSNLFKLKATAHLPEDYTLLLKSKVGNKKFDTELKITTPSFNIDGNCDFEMTESAITGSFILSTPFTHFRANNIRFEQKIAATGFVTKLNVLTSLPTIKSLEAILKHDGSYNHFTTSGKITLDSHRMNFALNHRGELSDFTSRASMTINGETANAQAAFQKAGNKIIGSASINTPFNGFEKMIFNVNHAGRITDFTSSASVTWNDEAITGEVMHKKTHNKITCSGSLTTPFSGFEKMTFNQNFVGHLTDFRSTLSVALNDEGITGTAAFKKAGSEISSSASLTTPFTGFEKMTFTLNYAGHLTDFTSSSSVALNDEAITGNVAFEKTDNAITSSASLTTPFTRVEKLTFSLNHVCHLTDFTSSASVTMNNEAITGNAAFKMHGNKITSSASLTTPFSNVEKVTFNLNHVGHLTDFTSSSSVALNGEAITGNVAFKKQSNKITSSGSVTTPFSDVEKVTFNLNHVGHLTDFTSRASVTLNDEAITGNLAFKKQGNKINSYGSVTTPFSDVEKVTFNLNHVGLLTNFTTSASMSLNDEIITGNVAFEQTDNTFTSTASLTTPFSIANKITFTLNHAGHMTDFTTGASFAINDEAIMGNVAFRNTGNTITSSASFSTPFTGFEKMTFNLNHTGHLTDFTSSASVALNDFEITGELTFKKTGNTIISSGVLKTPVTSFRRNTFNFNHAGHITDFTSSASLAINREGIRGDVTVKKTFNKITSSASLTTPLIGFEKLTFTMNQEGDMTDFKSSSSLALNDAAVTGELTFKKTGTKIAGSATLTTPITSFRPATFTFEHVGHITNFTSRGSVAINGEGINGELIFKRTGYTLASSGSITTPVEGLEKMAFHFNHEGQLNDFTSTISVALNHDTIKSQVTFKKTDFMVNVSLATPFSGYERITLKLNHAGRLTDFTSTMSVAMNDEGITGQVTFKKTGNKIIAAVTITTPFSGYERMTFAIQGQLTTSSFSTAVTINGQTASVTVTYVKTANAITSSTTFTTPFVGLEKMTFTVNLEGVMTDFTSSASVALNDAAISGQLIFKKTGNKITTSLTISTPFSGYERMVIAFEGRLIAITTRASVTINGQTITVEYAFEKVGNRFTSSGSLTTPFANMERFAYKFNFEGGLSNFRTSGNIESPFINRDLAITFTITGELTDFVCKGSIASKGVRYAGNLRLKLADGTLKTVFGIETPDKKYDNVAVNIKQNAHSGGLRTSVDIATPFEGYRTLAAEINHEGNIRDFHTSGSLSGPITPIKFDLTHKGDLSAFTTGASVLVNNKRYASSVAGTNAFKFTDGNIDVSGSLDLPHLGEYSYNLKHLNTAHGFATEGSFQTPHEGFERASFDMTHEGTVNKFATSGRINPFSGEGSFNLNHARTPHAFTSAASAAWNTMSINGNAEFKNKDGNMEASAILTTPFEGLERFQADVKHSQQSKKIKTEASIQTPFRQIRNPSFVLDHRGHWKNFKTSLSLTTPFKTIKPMTINMNHRGIPRDFTTSANARYGRETMSTNARYQKMPNGFIALADFTPFQSAGKYGFNLEHSYDGNRLNTKGALETPHHVYNNFAIEVNHEGNLRKFDTTGKFETSFTRPVMFEMHHNGVPTDFESSVMVEREGQKVEGQAHYHHTDTSYEGFIKIATPHRYLRNAEATMTHTQGHKAISGNLKASYNTHKFDGDYSFAYGSVKSASLTLRLPKAMKYTVVVNPSAGTAETLIKWDTNSNDKYIRFEGTIKNTNTEHQVTVAMICPHHTKKLTAGYQKTDNMVAVLCEIQSDSNIFRQEIELGMNTRGREIIYDGKFKAVSPMVTFEVNGNNKVNPGRRYMTEVNIVTSETVTFRSDIKTPGGLGDFRSTFIIAHPIFSKDVVIGVDGKINTEKTLYDGKIDLEYAREKITFTGKIADESNRYRTRWIVQSHLKHPSNKVDITSETLYLNNKKAFNMNSKFSYLMSASNKMNTITGMLKFDKVTDEVKVNVVSPIKNFDVTGRRTINEASRQHYTISSSVDGHSMNAEIDVDQAVPSISTSLGYAPEKTLHMYAKYASADHFQMEAYRQVASRKYPEAAIDTEIVAGHLVKARVFLRPGAMSDLSELLSINTELGHFIADVSEIISMDIRVKVPGFKRAIEPVIKVIETVSQSFGIVAERTERFFSNNQFYTRDIATAIADFYRNVRATINDATSGTVGAIRSAGSLYRQAAAKFEEWRQVAVVKYNQWYTQAAAKMTEYRAEFHRRVAAHITNMQGSLLDLANAIRTNSHVQAFINSVQAKGERIMERLTLLADKLVQAAERLLAHPKLAFIREYITRANERTAWIFEYIDMEVQAREWLHQLKETGLSPIRRATWRLTRDLLHLDETRINKWAPEHGEIAGQVYIPMLMRDLRSMPTINFGNFIDNIKSHIPDTDWVFWDTLYAYKPSSDIRNWIPPFKSHATIAGNQHYMTFDKKFYEFAGECSYLLARDFIDGTFSVIVNYETRKNAAKKKSMTIVHGNNKVEILPDFRVEMNGRRSELPIISEHTAVYRVGNTLRIDNDHGIKITCNLPHDHCTVAVTGWYFGKTAGLLGTYDNEPSTDFTTLGGEPAATTEEFAHSWTAGRTCRATNRAVQQVISPVHPKYDACATIYQAQTSAFRPCFRQRDPAPFMQMCINGDMCKVASFYVTECKLIEVPIRMPRQCVTCQLPSGVPMSERQEMTIRDAQVPKNADVIFVVSHGECNQEAIPKMTTLANQILSSMKEQGITSVKFGIVGYGGEGIETSPHSHTMDGHLLNTKTTFLRTMSKFHTMAYNNEDEDALNAVEFASHYAFRAGASKSIVLMPCYKCNTKNVAYATIQTALSDQDIKFHMLIQEDFKLKAYSKSPKTSFMYGVDRTSVFTAKDARGGPTIGDSELRRHTQVPKDLCVALTHETDGSVFNLRKLTETKPVQQKRFATVLGRVIANKGAPATCQHCECRSDESGIGMTVCHPCAPVVPYVYTWDMASLPAPDMPIHKSRSL